MQKFDYHAIRPTSIINLAMNKIESHMSKLYIDDYISCNKLDLLRINVNFKLLHDYVNRRDYSKALKLIEVLIDDVMNVKGKGYVTNVVHLYNIKESIETAIRMEEKIRNEQ